MFSRSGNPFLILLLSYYVLVSSENSGQLPVQEVLMILSYEFLKLSSVFMFSRSRNPLLSIPTGLPCSSDLENLSQLPVLGGS